MNRRELAKLLALCGSSGLLGVPRSSSAASPTTPRNPRNAEEPEQLAQALTRLVRAQHGRFLTPEELQRIAGDFASYVPQLDRLRAVPLTNADAPD